MPIPDVTLKPSLTKLLLVEDEESIAVPVRRGLEEEGYHVDVAPDGEQGLRLALGEDYDLLVVDWRLPGMDGRTVVERLRAARLKTPVLMLTALRDVDHRVAGLDAGADDYLTKPFAFAELLARLRALARRVTSEEVPVGHQKIHLETGPLHMDTVRRTVHLCGRLLDLRSKEYRLLELLLRLRGGRCHADPDRRACLGIRLRRHRQRHRHHDLEPSTAARRGSRRGHCGAGRRGDRARRRLPPPRWRGRERGGNLMEAAFRDIVPTKFRLSISTRLTLWYGLSLLILLSLFVIFLYTSFHVSLHRDFETQLRRDEERIRAAVEVGVRGPELREREALRSVALQTEGVAGTYVRLFTPSGAVLYRSPNFDGQPMLDPALPQMVEPDVVGRTWQGAPARSRYVPLVDGQELLAGWLEVTRLESTLHHELHRLRWLLVVGVLLGSAVAIASGYGLARRALRPVATITGAAREIEAGDLGRRLPSDFGVRDELTDLAETLNALLVRLDASFERERRFRADAAHEMFTPISALQSEIDVALLRPREAAYYRETLNTLREHVQRLAGLVEGLLRLSRAEAGGATKRKNVDVSDVVRHVVERFRTSADARCVRLVCNLAPEVPAAVGATHLEAVAENLIDNAIKYTPPEGIVTVCTSVEEDEAVLRVSDTGVGFSEDEADRLFDRFYRADARTVQQVRGSGLGLSIVKAFVDTYAGRVTARSEGPGRGSIFEVHLPMAPPGHDGY